MVVVCRGTFGDLLVRLRIVNRLTRRASSATRRKSAKIAPVPFAPKSRWSRFRDMSNIVARIDTKSTIWGQLGRCGGQSGDSHAQIGDLTPPRVP